jgi:plastocyanin
MRVAFLTTAGVAIALGAAAAPASAADVNIRNFAFSPTSVTIPLGDTVIWHYQGPDTNHSVTSDEGQADSWDSDPGRRPNPADHPIGSTYERKFDLAGSFTYYCKVHPSMKGKVVVEGPGGGDPPPGDDKTPPAISGLTAKGGQTCAKSAPKSCKRKATVVRYTLSEDAQVKIEVPGRPKASTTRAGKLGSNTVRISTRKLPPGKYTVELTATDAAGNASEPAEAKVRVRKRR